MRRPEKNKAKNEDTATETLLKDDITSFVFTTNEKYFKWIQSSGIFFFLVRPSIPFKKKLIVLGAWPRTFQYSLMREEL